MITNNHLLGSYTAKIDENKSIKIIIRNGKRVLAKLKSAMYRF